MAGSGKVDRRARAWPAPAAPPATRGRGRGRRRGGGWQSLRDDRLDAAGGADHPAGVRDADGELRRSSPGTPPSESNLDTSRIQNGAQRLRRRARRCSSPPSGANNGFITGPIHLPTGVSLWVDTGVTLFGTRDPSVYNQAAALISVSGANSGIYGPGIIDGQGGEPQIGSTMSSWDINGGGGDNPALIQALGATNFTLYKITLHNAPKFHVKLGAAGFVVWGITIKTPSTTTNSVGTKLTPSSAHNTDGIDPGEAASNGFIVYNKISDGDDHIAIKGGTSVRNLTIAHNHFEAGHGMSIGSETNGGVSDVTVCDLSIDGTNTRALGRQLERNPHQVGREPRRSRAEHLLRRRLHARPHQPDHPHAQVLVAPPGRRSPVHRDHHPELPLDRAPRRRRSSRCSATTPRTCSG